MIGLFYKDYRMKMRMTMAMRVRKGDEAERGERGEGDWGTKWRQRGERKGGGRKEDKEERRERGEGGWGTKGRRGEARKGRGIIGYERETERRGEKGKSDVRVRKRDEKKIERDEGEIN